MGAVEYMTSGEAAKRWGISGRRINYYLTAGRIPGAFKKGKLWLLPADAERPADRRRTGEPSLPPFLEELNALLAAAAVPMPFDRPDRILEDAGGEWARLPYEAELAYLRGDFERVTRLFHKTEGREALRLRVCPITVAAVISLGDYPAYAELEAYLKKCAQEYKGSVAAVLAEHALATAAVSVIAPGMVPDWLKDGDFSALAPQMKPNALYLRAKYFLCVGNYEAMLAVAQTARTLYAGTRGFTPTDIYLHLTCAVACHYLGREDEARRCLTQAMHIFLPHGFFTPFSEIVTALGGLMEQCLEREFPACLGAVLGQWKRTWKNWMAFHNQFTKDNITIILSLREYHIAFLVARRVPYAEIAKQHCVSVGRVKNIMLGVYEKLCISGRDELGKYIII